MSTDHESVLDSFPGLPPFPTAVPTAPLLRISLSRLCAGDKEESARLFSASQALGFFYLDLRNDPQGSEILSEADELFKVGEELFELGREELSKYDYSEQGSSFGYKGFGRAFVDEKGSLDRNEFYNVSLQNHLWHLVIHCSSDGDERMLTPSAGRQRRFPRPIQLALRTSPFTIRQSPSDQVIYAQRPQPRLSPPRAPDYTPRSPGRHAHLPP